MNESESTRIDNILQSTEEFLGGKRPHALFGVDYGSPLLALDNPSTDRIRTAKKFKAEFEAVQDLPPHIAAKLPAKLRKAVAGPARPSNSKDRLLLTGSSNEDAQSQALTIKQQNERRRNAGGIGSQQSDSIVQRHKAALPVRPEWHAPWKLMRVISGHLGWVRSLCVEPGNEWFASGAADRTIKIWDLASGTLKLTLTGHIMAIRGLAVSPRHPYLFSCGEDKKVLCWDLEQNKVIRQYHGHLSGVFALDLHPTLDVLVTAGRDAVARVWDMRTRNAIHVLSGHKATVSAVKCQAADPQVITGSMDSTVRLWDLAAGKTQTVLTHHKKSVRALAVHPQEFTFASASPDNIKEWKCPEGTFLHNFEPRHNAIVNTLSVNNDGVCFSGGDDGTMGFFDWSTGHKFQATQTALVPGSLEAEKSIFASTFDKTGLRLITGEADKSIKIWREDPNATPETDPGIEWKPTLGRSRY